MTATRKRGLRCSDPRLGGLTKQMLFLFLLAPLLSPGQRLVTGARPTFAGHLSGERKSGTDTDSADSAPQ
jgi:hypothetical protein